MFEMLVCDENDDFPAFAALSTEATVSVTTAKRGSEKVLILQGMLISVSISTKGVCAVSIL